MLTCFCFFSFFFSSRRRHTRCALVTGVQTCALPIFAAYFTPPPFETGLPDDIDRSDPDFALWVDQQVIAHKTPGYAIANISLKPIGGIGGDATAEQMEVVADLAERYSFDDVRVTHAQNLVLPHVRKQDLYAVWQALHEAGLADANLDLVTDVIACPGLDYCTPAHARSTPVDRKSAASGKSGSYRVNIGGR